MTGRTYIHSLATAAPDFSYTQPEGMEFILDRYSGVLDEKGRELMRKVFAHPSVRRRRFAFNDPDVLLRETFDERMERFQKWSVELSARAAGEALERAGFSPADVSVLAVNTCTGYLCPGITSYLMERMNLPRTVLAFDLVGSGCSGAIPNLQTAQGVLRGIDSGVALCVSSEICSCTFEMGNDPSLIVSNAIFGDGAAAAIVSPRPGGLRLEASEAWYAPEYRDDVRFMYRNGRLHNRLSRRLPVLAGKAAAAVTGNLLGSRGLKREDIRHWAVHPGGESIIEAVGRRLGLEEEFMRHTRSILSEYGNLSSATVWFVLRSILDEGVSPGDRIVMLAFGAGMSAHALLLEAE